MLPKTPASSPQQVFMIARRQHSNFSPWLSWSASPLVAFLVCGGTSKARPGNYNCYHALVSCNQAGRLCAGDHRVIAILPPTFRMWHLKEEGFLFLDVFFRGRFSCFSDFLLLCFAASLLTLLLCCSCFFAFCFP